LQRAEIIVKSSQNKSAQCLPFEINLNLPKLKIKFMSKTKFGRLILLLFILALGISAFAQNDRQQTVKAEAEKLREDLRVMVEEMPERCFPGMLSLS
jgi:hypothetical protein